jgi:hypothetical protein
MTTWYLPTFYGDIRLESQDGKVTKVVYEKLTPQEEVAMRALFLHALKKDWASEKLVEPLQKQLGALIEKPIEMFLNAKITDVQKILSKPLKPGRKMISAVRFSGGAIEEITSANIGLIEGDAQVLEEKDKPLDKSGSRAKPKVAATTVAAPVIGCPAPDFVNAEIRATRVLEAFLTPEQLEDFRTENAFVAVGHDSGHKYMITSRHARTKLYETARSLYDLTEQHPICVHDWSVPAAEEMLGLLVMVSLPGKESFVRFLPDDGADHSELLLDENFEFPPVPVAQYPIPLQQAIRVCRIPEDV